MTQLFSDTLNIETIKHCPVIVGEGIIDRLAEYFDFSSYSSIVMISDSHVTPLYGQDLIKALEVTRKKIAVFTMPAGERAKSLRVAERGYRFLLENGIDRRALICTLGGGVVGDGGGYIAATYLRGLDYLQLPTTLLAQVDSGIGGKVAVNFGGKKNMIGSFYQPKGIISDVALLKSLPPREMRNGLAEVIKYAVAMDKELFGILEQKGQVKFDAPDLIDIVRRCAYLKARVVEVDETEQSGERAILNFGHTIGHALEVTNRLQGSRHGEAVAIGMVAAARISAELGLLNKGDINRVEKLLHQFGLPISCPQVNPEDLMEATRFDKKTTHGETRWVLLQDIGSGVVNQPVPEPVVRKVLTEVCQ